MFFFQGSSEDTIVLYVGPQQVFILPRGEVSPVWSDVSTVLYEDEDSQSV